MKFYRILATIIIGASLCLLGYQSAFAQGKGKGDPHPDSSVEGRTYCFVVDILRMRSPSSSTTTLSAALSSTLIRRTATFSGGVITATGVDLTENRQNADTGAVTQTTGAGGTVTGTYVQTGPELAVVLTFATFSITTTWYVSKDGSVINGSLSTLREDLTFGASDQFEADFGETRTWTLVENDSCDTAGFITEI